MKRMIAWMLALCLLLTGCRFRLNIQLPTEPTVPEPVSHERLIFALQQSDVDEFYRLLQESERMAQESEDEQAVDEITDETYEQLERISDQIQIAYILYCADQSDTAMEQQYLDALEILSQAINAYNESIRRIYLSDTPFKDMLFEEWTEKDIATLLAYTEEANDLETTNEKLRLQYRALSTDDKESKLAAFYNELVSNNNRIAQIFGYDNFYEYASDSIYDRDYTQQSVTQMRQYLAQYLAPAAEELVALNSEKWGNLSYNAKKEAQDLRWADYRSLKRDYVAGYLEDLPEEIREQMEKLFTENRLYMANRESAYAGAFTTTFGDGAFCYFGPGYSVSGNIIHELGHFYSTFYSDLDEVPLDLAEVHSQSNEWLFLAYLKDELPEDIYQAVFYDTLFENIAVVLTCMMVDEFEQLVYTHPNAGNLTEEDYDGIMEQITVQYGGLAYTNQNICDIQRYWKHVVMENPCYYISYAVSNIAALNLYTLALSDEEQAREIYRLLCEEGDEEKGFLWNIQNAGLAGPFDEKTYQDLQKMLAG